LIEIRRHDIADSALTSSAPASWSMRRDPRADLWDAREAADAIAGFMQGRRFDDYAGDLMFRSAVERQLAVIGEALSQLARVDQGLAARIPEVRRVIAFRNVLIHGYDRIDNAGVWRIVEADLPPLRKRVADLLVELGNP
jgi:uncharacterized protein with HEPN domain